MKKNQAKLWIGCGIFCVAAMLLSVWYAVTFNNSRLVTPTDLGSYTFTPKDLPMLLSVSLFCIYVFALCLLLMVNIRKRKRSPAGANITRRINPRLGLLGPCWAFWALLAFGPTPPPAMFRPLCFSCSSVFSASSTRAGCPGPLWMNGSGKTPPGPS